MIRSKGNPGFRRVVLTQDQKEEYMRRALDRAAIKKPKSKRKMRCPKCKRRFSILFANQSGHSGYCSRRCLPGAITPPRIIIKPRIDVKKERQERRQIRIKTPEKICFYDSKEWREVRFKVLRKYGYQCLACGRKPPEVVIHVDHIKPRSKYPNLELDINNLQPLCADCNIGKNNYSEEDLRPKEAVDFLTDAAKG